MAAILTYVLRSKNIITAINPTASEPEKEPGKRIKWAQMSAIGMTRKRRKRSGGKTIRTIGKNIAPKMIGTPRKTGFGKGSETVPAEVYQRDGFNSVDNVDPAF